VVLLLVYLIIKYETILTQITRCVHFNFNLSYIFVATIIAVDLLILSEMDQIVWKILLFDMHQNVS